MNNTIKFFVDNKNSEKRLDIFLAENIKEFSRSFLKKLIKNKQVKLNNDLILSSSTKVKYNDQILIKIINKDVKHIIPKKISLNVIYEDKDILILNKPKGMVVHPGAGNYSGVGVELDTAESALYSRIVDMRQGLNDVVTRQSTKVEIKLE